MSCMVWICLLLIVSDVVWIALLVCSERARLRAEASDAAFDAWVASYRRGDGMATVGSMHGVPAQRLYSDEAL